MELTYRKGADAFVPTGEFHRLSARLRDRLGDLADTRTVVIYPFDVQTRMLPFILYDKRIFPAGPRTIAGTLHQAGFNHVRALFQLWNPNFRPSEAELDGRPIELLMVSAMQIHAEEAYRVVSDAWKMGENRPLIIVGGAKAVHEPYHFWPLATPGGPGGADVVVTGEAFILLDLLNVLADHHRPGEPIRKAFERARHAGALDSVPGLVYLDPASDWQNPVLVETGLQRLLQHLDELPDDAIGLKLLEPPHRGRGLSSQPLAAKNVRKYAPIVGLQITQGCKFSCPYCPIPSLNQKTWRFRTPQGLAHQFRTMREQYGIKFYFGADDNFMNRRATAEEFFEELSRARISLGGRQKRLGHQVRWSTEATQADTWKNRDLLPLAASSGLFGLWFGIEDLTAELVNKGQKPEVTTQLFKLMHKNKLLPMAMMMFHDEQKYRTPGKLSGIADQVQFLQRAGAISIQVMVHVPAVGTKQYEELYESGKVVKALGEYRVPESFGGGGHVIVMGKRPGWQRQVEQLGAYFTFYNPLNLFRSLRKDGSPLRWYRVAYQAIGFVATCRTALRVLPYWLKLISRKPTFHTKTPALTRVPVRDARQGFSRYLPGNLPKPTVAPADAPRRSAA